jgi:hypothetical protein
VTVEGGVSMNETSITADYVTILNGTVTAAAPEYGINSPNIVIKGGSVKATCSSRPTNGFGQDVYLNTLQIGSGTATNFAGGRFDDIDLLTAGVASNAKEYSMFGATPDDKKFYLWLPAPPKGPNHSANLKYYGVLYRANYPAQTNDTAAATLTHTNDTAGRDLTVTGAVNASFDPTTLLWTLKPNSATDSQIKISGVTYTERVVIETENAWATVTLENLHIDYSPLNCAAPGDAGDAFILETSADKNANLLFKGANTVRAAGGYDSLATTGTGTVNLVAAGELGASVAFGTVDNANTLNINPSNVRYNDTANAYLALTNALTVAAKQVKAVNIANGTVTIDGNVTGEATITGGNVTIGGTAQNGAKISGGSVKITSPGTVFAANGTTRVWLNTLTVGEGATLAQDAAVSAAAESYGVSGVKTDADGKLFFWLPEATESNFTVTAKGAIYGKKFARAANNENAATLIADNSDLIILTDNGQVTFDTQNNTHTITANGSYTVSGSTVKERITLQGGVNATVTLQNVDITLNTPGVPLYVTGTVDAIQGATATLILVGNNCLRGADLPGMGNNGGIELPSGATLTIDADDNDQTLTVLGSGDSAKNVSGATGHEGGAGIRLTGGTLNIAGGTVTAAGNVNGAGVGGSSNTTHETTGSGTLNVTGGVLNANGDTNGGTGGTGYSGAGIGGSGARPANLTVTVSGGEVNAQGGPGAAGIGGGGAVSGTHAGYGGLQGTITVNGGTLTATAGTSGGAGGSGYSCAAGIGSSYTSWNNQHGGVSGMSVVVNGGTLVAKGSGTERGTAGIGGYLAQGSLCVNGGVVLIENGYYSERSIYPKIGTFTVNGGSVSVVGIPYEDQGTLVKNAAGENVYINTLTVGDPAVPETKITGGKIGTADDGAFDKVAHTGTGNKSGTGYGIHDVLTDADGKLYFWLPATQTSPPFVAETVEARTGTGAGEKIYGAKYVRTPAGNEETLYERAADYNYGQRDLEIKPDTGVTFNEDTNVWTLPAGVAYRVSGATTKESIVIAAGAATTTLNLASVALQKTDDNDTGAKITKGSGPLTVVNAGGSFVESISGGVTLNGAGTFTAGTFTGDLTLGGGAALTAGTVTGGLTASGTGSVNITGVVGGSANITGAGAAEIGTVAGDLTAAGTGDVTVTGAVTGKVTKENKPGKLTVNGAGGADIQGGMVSLGAVTGTAEITGGSFSDTTTFSTRPTNGTAEVYKLAVKPLTALNGHATNTVNRFENIKLSSLSSFSPSNYSVDNVYTVAAGTDAAGSFTVYLPAGATNLDVRFDVSGVTAVKHTATVTISTDDSNTAEPVMNPTQIKLSKWDATNSAWVPIYQGQTEGQGAFPTGYTFDGTYHTLPGGTADAPTKFKAENQPEVSKITSELMLINGTGAVVDLTIDNITASTALTNVALGTLNLYLSGTNTLTDGSYKLLVNQDGRTMNIYGPGTLNAPNAILGASDGDSMGLVNIHGGVINANRFGVGQYVNNSGHYGSLTVTGGRVTTTGNYSQHTSMSISGGTFMANGADLISQSPQATSTTFTASGGSFKSGGAWSSSAKDGKYLNTLTVGNPSVGANQKIDTLTVGTGVLENEVETTVAYGSNDIYTDADGKIYLWLPVTTQNATVTAAVGGTTYSAEYLRAATNANAETLLSAAATVISAKSPNDAEKAPVTVGHAATGNLYDDENGYGTASNVFDYGDNLEASAVPDNIKFTDKEGNEVQAPEGLTYNYQWWRLNEGGTTREAQAQARSPDPTYKITPDDVGRKLEVVVTAVGCKGWVSALLGPIEKAPAVEEPEYEAPALVYAGQYGNTLNTALTPAEGQTGATFVGASASKAGKWAYDNAAKFTGGPTGHTFTDVIYSGVTLFPYEGASPYKDIEIDYTPNAGNLYLPAEGKVTVMVTARLLYINVSPVTRPYDGTKAITVTGTLITGDGALYLGDGPFSPVSDSVSGTVESKDVGNGKNVTLTGAFALAESGNGWSNYMIVQPTGVTANIEPATLTPGTATITPRNYNGTKTATVQTLTLTGAVSGETLEYGTDYTATGVYDNENAYGNTNAATKVTVTPALKSTDLANNYVLAKTDDDKVKTIEVAATIGKAPLTLDPTSSVVPNKTYNNSEAATVTSVAFTGLATGEYFTKGTDYEVTNANFADKTAGTHAVTATVALKDTDKAKNYSLSDGAFSKNATITPASATVTFPTAATITYGQALSDSTLSGGSKDATLPDGTSYGTFEWKDGATTKPNANTDVGDTDPTSYSVTFTPTDAAARDYGLTTQTANVAVTVNKKELTATNSVIATRYYDGTTDATVQGLTLTGAVSGEDLVYKTDYTATGVYDNKNAAENTNAATKVTVTPALKDTDLAKNYVLAEAGGNVATIDISATINKAPLTLNPAGSAVPNKTYDNNTTATVTSVAFNGLVTGEYFTKGTDYEVTNANFAEKDAGTHAVTATVALTTTDKAKNYSLSNGAFSKNATITPASATVTFPTAATPITYGQALSASTLSGGSVTPNPSDESASYGTFAWTAPSTKPNANTDTNDTDPASYEVTFTPTTAAARDYGLSTQKADVAVTVNKKELTVTASVAQKTYDGTTTATVNSLSFSGLVNDETLTEDTHYTIPSAQFNDKDAGENKAGTFTVTLKNTAAANNYKISNNGVGIAFSGAEITKRAVTVSATVAQKTYDGTTAATAENVIITGFVEDYTPGTDYTLTAAFTDATAGAENKTVTLTLTPITENDGKGADIAKNYTVTAANLTGQTILRRPVSITGVTASKTYDGTTVGVTLSNGTLESEGEGRGLVASDASDTSAVGFTLGTGTVPQKTAGTEQTVTTAITLTGTKAANYALAQPTDVKVTIQPKQITPQGVTATKTYDGNANFAANHITIPPTALDGGKISNDDLTLTKGTVTGGTVADTEKGVGTGKTLTITGAFALAGAAAANYVLTQPTVLVSITAATPAAGDFAFTQSVTYNGQSQGVTVSASEAFTAASKDGMGSVTKTYYTGADTTNYPKSTTAPTNAGTYAITVDLAAGTNYGAAAGLQLGTYTINKAALTISSATTAAKTYDGTTTATVTDVSLGGLVNDETFTQGADYDATADFNDAAAGENKTVTVTVTPKGTTAANYALSQNTYELTGQTIEPKPVTVTGVTATNRVYNGGTSVALTGGTLTGVISADSTNVSLTAGTGAATDKNVGTGKTVTAAGYALTGDKAGNYALTQPTGVTVNIAKRPLTPQGITATKIYDGDGIFTAADLTGTADALTTASGKIETDNLTLNETSATGTLTNTNVQSTTLALSGFTLEGTDKDNYELNQPSVNASITAKQITLDPANSTVLGKVYNGTDVATGNVTSVAFSGTVLGQTLVKTADYTVSNELFDSAEAGTNKTVSATVTLIPTGNIAKNYTLESGAFSKGQITISKATSSVTLTATAGTPTTETPVTLTAAVSGAGATPTGNVQFSYTPAGGDKTAIGGPVALNGGSAGTTVTLSAAGTYTLTAEYLGDTNHLTAADTAGNYSVSHSEQATLSITGVPTAVTHGDTAFTLATSGGSGEGDVTFTEITGNVINVSAAGLVTVKSAGGPVTVTAVKAGDGTYNPKTATVAITVLPKNLSGATITLTGGDSHVYTGGKIEPDVASVYVGGVLVPTSDYSVTYGANLTVAAGGSVTVTGKNNHTGTAAKTFTITPKSLANGMIQNIGAQTYTGLQIKPAVEVKDGDTTLTADDYEVAYPDANGVNLNVSAGGSVTVTGKGNYKDTAYKTFAITPVTLTITGATLTPKTYDGQTGATVNGVTFTGFVPNEAFTINTDYTATAAFNTAAAGTGKTVTVTVTPKGTTAANYALSQNTYTRTDQTIAKKQLAFVTATVADKTYDGQTTATVTAVNFTGFVPNEAFTINTDYTAAGVFNSKNVADANQVTLSFAPVADSKAANYALPATATVTGKTIAPKDLTLTGVTATKTYDGTDEFTADSITAVLDGIVDSDAVTLDKSGVTGTLASANVGSGTLELTGSFALTGDDADNYALTQPTAIPASITQATAPDLAWPTAGEITYGAQLGTSALSGGGTAYGSFAWTNQNTVPLANDAGQTAPAAYPAEFTPNTALAQNYDWDGVDFTQNVPVTVKKATVQMTLAAAPTGGGNANDTITLTATVNGPVSAAPPTGTVALSFTRTDGEEQGGGTIDAALQLNAGVAVKDKQDYLAGNYGFKALYGGDDNHKASDENTAGTFGKITSYKIDRIAQTPEFKIKAPGEKTYGAAGFTLETEGGSGTGAVTFTSITGGTVVNLTAAGKVTVVGAGTVTVYAKKAHDNVHNEATASLSLTVKRKALTEGMVSGVADSYVYTGAEIKPPVTVADGDLLTGADYTVTYGDNTNVTGGGTVTVAGENNYAGTVIKTFAIEKATPTVTLTASPASPQPYGAAITLTAAVGHPTENDVPPGNVQFFDGDTALGGQVALTNGLASFTPAANLATGAHGFTAVYTPAGGNYNGQTSTPLAYTIDKIQQATLVIASPGAKTYGDAPFDLTTGASGSGGGTVTYALDTANGVAEVTSTGKVTVKKAGSFTVRATKAGDAVYEPTTATLSITVGKKQLADAMIANIAERTYTGSTIAPLPTVTDGNPSLISASDYTVSYGENTNVVGGGTVTIKGTTAGNYEGMATAVFDIVPKTLTKAMVSGVEASYVYTGAKIEPAVTVTDGASLVQNLDYEVAYGANLSVADDGTVAVTGIGNYKDTAEIPFGITPKSLSGATISGLEASYAYTGAAVEPAATVAVAGIPLVQNADYTVSYGADHTNVGTVTLTVTGTGNYKDTAEKTFTIAPAPLTITGATINPKTYDGQKAATVTDVNFTGFVNGETFAITEDYTATGEFDGKNVADAGKVTLTVEPVADSKAANYILPAAYTLENQSIAKKQLEFVDADIAQKTYDGQTTATVNGVSFTGFENNEIFEIGTDYTAAGVFNSKNVADASEVTLTFEPVSAKAANYSLPATATVTGKTISPRPLTVAGVTATKTYDGTNAFANGNIDISAAVLSEIVGSDDVTLDKTGVTGTLPGANVGNGTLTRSGDFTLTGDDAGNYALTQPTVTASITKATAPALAWPTAAPVTYGAQLGTSALSGGGTAYGAFAWKNPSTVPPANDAGQSEAPEEYPVNFTPNTASANNYDWSGIALTQNVPVTVKKAAVQMTLAAAPTGGGKANDTITLTATVNGPVSAAPPTGTVALSFTRTDGAESGGGTIDAALELNAGVATKQKQDYEAGDYGFKALYAGDANHQASDEDTAGTFGEITSYQITRIAQTELSITGVPDTVTYGDAEFKLETAGGSGTGAVAFTPITDGTVVNLTAAGKVTVVGAGTVTVYAKKAHDNVHNEATATLSLTVNPKTLTGGMVSGVADSYVYTGAEIKPPVTVKDGGASLAQNLDYTALYGANLNVADGGTVTVTGKGNYAGAVTKTFEIEKATPTVTLTASPASPQPYGAAITLTAAVGRSDTNDVPPGNVRFFDGDTALGGQVALDSNGLASFAAPLDLAAGDHVFTAVFTPAGGNYNGKTSTPLLYAVDRIPQETPLVIRHPDAKTYGDEPFALETEGGSGTGAVTYAPVAGSDVAEVTATGAVTVKKAGSFTVRATKAGDAIYGPAAATLEITVGKKQLADAMIANIAARTFTGSPIVPLPTVTDGDPSLIKPADYTISYGANTNAGRGTVTITCTAAGNYAGTATAGFDIVPKTLTKAMVSGVADSYVYTGAKIEPPVTLTDGGAILAQNIDYTVLYGENRNVAGGGSVTVAGIGNYAGREVLTFGIARAPLTATASSHTISFGGALPVPTVRYEGFVGGEDETVLAVRAEAKLNVRDSLKPGESAVTFATRASGANYAVTHAEGRLTVNAARPSAAPPRTSAPVPAPASVVLPGGAVVTTRDGKPPAVTSDGLIPLPGGGTVTWPGGFDLDVRPGTTVLPNAGERLGYLLDAGGAPFEDVKDGDWFCPDVRFVYGHGLFEGTSASPMLFSPYGEMTRGMTVTVLHRLAEEPDTATGDPFSDVPPERYCAKAVAWAKQIGMVDGVGGGLFEPDRVITREETLSVFYRYAKLTGFAGEGTLPAPEFADAADVSVWAEEAVKLTAQNGIVTGKPGNILDPKGQLIRAEFAALLHRFIGATAAQTQE